MKRFTTPILILLAILLISGGAWGQPISVTKAGIPPGTTRSDGSAHQNNDTLIWLTAYNRWVAQAGGGAGTWGSITGTISGQTDLITLLGGANIPSPTEFSYVKGLSSAVQTQLGTMLLKSLGTGKGTIVGFSAASTPGTLAVGTDGYLLQADAASTLGFRWTAVPQVSGVATNFLDGNATYRDLLYSDLPATRRINPSPADTTFSGDTIQGINGEAGSMAIGDIVCIANGTTNTAPTFKFAKADSTASALMPAVAMCTATVTTGATGTFLLRGTIQNTGWSALTVGAIAGTVWVSVTGTTANTWTQTKPVTSGNVQMYTGCAINDAYSAAHTGQSKTMFFNPSPVWNVAP